MTESNQNNSTNSNPTQQNESTANSPESTNETENVIRDNGIKYKNTLYEVLQQKIDRTFPDPYEFKELTNIGITVYTTPKTVVNASGNLKISVKLLLEAGSKPNYAEMIIMNGFNTAPKVTNIPESIQILLKTLISPNFVVESTPVTNLEANPAPAGVRGEVKYQPNNPENLFNMLNEHVKNPLYAWNLNYNRNLTVDEVKKISAHVMTKFNEIIEYVINNDIKKPDEKFRSMVKNIFVEGSNIYSFAHFTLMLPALVNYISRSLNDKKTHATRYIGIVKSGSGLMPKKAVNLREEIKWYEGGAKITAESVCPYGFIHNGQFKANIGGYNYPFSQANYDKNRFKPSTVPLNTKNANDPVVKNIPIAFKEDKFKYVNPNNMPIAVVNGTHKQPEPEYGFIALDKNTHYSKWYDYTPWSWASPQIAAINCNKTWSDPVTVSKTRTAYRSESYQCNCRQSCSTSKCGFLGLKRCTSCSTVCDNCTRQVPYTQTYNDTEYRPGSCSGGRAAIGPIVIGDPNRPVSKQICTSYVTSQVCNNASSSSRDCGSRQNTDTKCGIGEKVTLGKISTNGLLDEYSTGKYCMNGTNCGAGSPLVNSVDITATYIDSRPAYNSGVGGVNKTITAGDPTHYYSEARGYKDYKQIAVQTIKRTFTGEFGNKLIAGPANSECGDVKPSRLNTTDHALRNIAITHLFHTTQDINYFCDEVFNDWMWIILQPKALQKLLDDIRSLLISNPELILITKINDQLGDYFRTFGKDDASLVDLPFASPLINVGAGSMILPSRMYHSEFKVNKGIDTKNNVHQPKFFNNNVITTLQPDTESKEYKPLNYLDNAYSLLFDSCKNDKRFDETKAVAMTIPRHGCQLFETVAEYQDSSSTKRINHSGPLVKILDTVKVGEDSLLDDGKTVRPRILAKVGGPLNDKIVDAYELLNSAVEIHVPVINIHKQDGELTVEINTSSEDPANKLYVYIAKVANALGNYTAKMNSFVNSKTNTPMNVVDIEYDGNESKVVPDILKRRFT